MGMTKNIAAYYDVREVFDTAIPRLKAGEDSLLYEVESRGAAVHWLQRAYMFRKLAMEQEPDRKDYARIVLRREGSTIHVTFRQSKGKLLTEAGTQVAVQPGVEFLDELTEEEAARLRKELDLETENGD